MPKIKLNGDAVAGIVLLLAAALALAMDNSALAGLYDSLLRVTANVSIGEAAIKKPLVLWINDGLMAIFFLLVALEIKREIIEGKLSSFQQAALPSLAAVGGMAAPALIYALINQDNPATIGGWAIPAATDIAFALGILSLFGTRVPPALKLFLLALAIMDDMGAIIIIALFYSADLSGLALMLAAGGTAVLFLFNRLGVTRVSPYILVGIFIWVCVLKSGVHATLAGVVVGLMIPLYNKDKSVSPLKSMEHGLHPYVLFLIMPIFAFANAGVSLAGISVDDMMAPVPLGVALGLFLGNQVGIMTIVFLAVKFLRMPMPEGVNWGQMYGVSLLAGVGFTMSLFIGTLAFSDVELQAAVRLGVLAGSALSAVVGCVVLALTLPKTAVVSRKEEQESVWEHE